MLSDDGLWIVYDNMVSKFSPDSESTSWTLNRRYHLTPYEAQQIVVISSNTNETQVQIKDKTGQDRGKPWISYSNDPIKTTILPDGRLWICTPKFCEHLHLTTSQNTPVGNPDLAIGSFQDTYHASRLEMNLSAKIPPRQARCSPT